MRIKRQIQKPIHKTFNDGFLQYGYDQIKRDENRKRIGETFVGEGKLAFSEMSARDEDYQMAGYNNASLDLKIETLCPPNLKNVSASKLKCVIDNIKYDVIKVDRDKDKRYLYFYLQKVGVLDERKIKKNDGKTT